MKSILIPLILVVLFITAVGLFTQKTKSIIKSSPTPTAKKEVTVGGAKVTAEVADTDSGRKKGLGGRAQLCDDCGMLFDFTGEVNLRPAFWMKEMLIPLDIIWISDGKVSQIHKNIATPAPNTPDSELPIYLPNDPIEYVLEVNAGFTDKNGIHEGSGFSF